MLPNLINTLSWWQWTILALVPPAIVLLYFLKLKRRPVEVPSTYLWHKSIEDLHVNSIWQRLRRNLLLFLQLLLLLLAVLALVRPGWRGEKLTGNRFVLLVDNSASMSATDVEPSRLDEAKRQAAAVLDQMTSGDSAMIVSFSDAARVEQTFTENRGDLYRALDAIRPTPRATNILEALKVSAGLANPGRSGEDITDFRVAQAMPATIYIFSDGCFPEVQGFSLGNLEPVFRKIGAADPPNIGITAFSAGQNEVRPDQLQAFAQLQNFGPEEVETVAELYLDDTLVDRRRMRIPAGQARGEAFPLSRIDSGTLRLRVLSGGRLALDDEAWVPVSPPRRARVLVVTQGNECLVKALRTTTAAEVADVVVETPAYMATPEYKTLASGRSLDLVIYDRCAPEEMPQANTLFVASVPPKPKAPAGEAKPGVPETGGKPEAKPEADADADAKTPDPGRATEWKAGEKAVLPGIIDTDINHPLMRWIDLGDVRIADGTPLEYPAGGSVLIDTDAGPMLVIAPREGFQDAVLGFPIAIYVQSDREGGVQGLLGWPIRRSFAVFMLNVLHILGNRQEGAAGGSLRPGSVVRLDALASAGEVSIRKPSGGTLNLGATGQSRLGFSGTDELGMYDVQAGGKTLLRFAVNMFSPAESGIAPKDSVQLGYQKVEGQSAWQTMRRELWKWLLGAGLVVLLAEWYIYNRRVFL